MRVETGWPILHRCLIWSVLYLVPETSMDVFKPVLPLFSKLKELHLHDVDRKLQVYKWAFDEKDRYRPIKQDNKEAWKSNRGRVEGSVSRCEVLSYSKQT